MHSNTTNRTCKPFATVATVPRRITSDRARTLRLDDHQFECLDSKAKALGVSGNQYVKQLVERDLGLNVGLGFDQSDIEAEEHQRQIRYREGEIVPRAERYMRNI